MRYLLGVLLFCLLGNLEAQERPDWVKQRPVSSMHYIGIACVSKSEKDYMQKAKQQALNDLISEIKVNVASTSLLHTLEENDRVWSEYEESIRVEARESVENFKMRGSWQSDTEYWVYYELNKFDYEEMVEKRREKAVREGFDYWWQGESSRNRGDLTIALACYLKGLEAIRPAINEELICSVEGKDMDVGHELYNSLLNLFRGITIRTTPGTVEGRAFQGVDAPVSVHVEREGVPLRNVALSCQFVSGDGVLSKELVTDESGNADLYIRNITSKEPGQEIAIVLNKSLFASLEKSVYKGMLKSVQEVMPQGRVNVSVKKMSVKAFLEVKDGADQVLKRVVSSLLTNSYFDLAESPSQADVLVLVKTEFRKGEEIPGEMYNLTAYYTTVNIDIVNNRSNADILHYGIDEMRSLAPAKNSLTAARNAAMTSVSKRLRQELEKELKRMNIDMLGDINPNPDRLKKKPVANVKPDVKVDAKPDEKKPVIVVKKPASKEPEYAEGELIPNLFVRYVGKKDYGDKTILSLKVINRLGDDYNMNLIRYDVKVVNEKGEEVKIERMRLGSSEDSHRVSATIVPDVEMSLVLEMKKIQSAKLIQISDSKGTVKLRNLK